MSQSLRVDLNREHLHEVAPAGPVFETDGSFDVAFRNHGRAVHVHVRLDGALSSVATVEGDNHFVDTDGTTTVRVTVDRDVAPIEGSVEFVTGYGSEEARVRVHVREPEPASVPTSVEESLGGRARETSAGVLPADADAVAAYAVPAVVLATAAAAVAAVTFALASSPALAAGAAVVLVVGVAAGYRLLA